MSVHELNVDPVFKFFKNSALPYFDAQLTPCADFEMRMGDCLEAYGLRKGKDKCKDFISDLRECLVNSKQKERVQLMRQERNRQWKSGEKKERFLETPAYDSY